MSNNSRDNEEHAVKGDLVRPPRYTCKHKGHPEACMRADQHYNDPYGLEHVDSATPCPDCGHPGMLVPTS
jgi:hypothetical protein